MSLLLCGLCYGRGYPGRARSDICGVKDICIGIGGISQGLEAIGFQKLAALECNPLMCERLRMNGYVGIMQGDVLNDLDRTYLHVKPSPVRCTIASGFPCQPLSTQGHQKGKDMFGPDHSKRS